MLHIQGYFRTMSFLEQQQSSVNHIEKKQNKYARLYYSCLW